MDKQYFVYILASARNGTLYIGMTNNLVRRVYEHRQGVVKGFTNDHNVKTLVYFETHADVTEAIRREKQVKGWNRKWKLDLIEKENPAWRDLWEDIAEPFTK